MIIIARFAIFTLDTDDSFWRVVWGQVSLTGGVKWIEKKATTHLMKIDDTGKFPKYWISFEDENKLLDMLTEQLTGCHLNSNKTKFEHISDFEMDLLHFSLLHFYYYYYHPQCNSAMNDEVSKHQKTIIFARSIFSP